MPRFVVFFLGMTAIFGVINLLALRRAKKAFQLERRGTIALGVLLFGSLAGTLLGRAARLGFDIDFGPVVPVSGIVQLAMLLTVALLAPLDLVRAGQRAWRFVPRFAARSRQEVRTAQEAPSQPAGTEAGVSRRAFLERATVGSAALVATSSSVYGTLHGRHDYQIEEVPLRVSGFPRALDGFTIAQLSDIHIGEEVGTPELAAAWEHVERCKPDLIVLTGDLLDNDPRYASELGRFAQRLQPLARHGVVAVTGNHDFYAGARETVAALERGGARVLRNRGVLLGDAGGSFALLGVDDVMGPRFEPGTGPDLDAALASVPQSADMPRVLLCHNPSYFERAAGRVDVQLSGHTHGGQIRLGVSPADLFLWHGWVRGRYLHQGSELYVNRGFGTVGPPARIGAPPEITKLMLHS